MFTSEKELVEKLIQEIQIQFDTKYIVRELRGGNNIADIVYTEDINRRQILFNEYFNAYYYFQKMYNKKKINLNNINITDKNANKKFYSFLNELEDMGYIKINDNYIETLKKIDAVTKNFIAIEAKISDWKSGLEQASRYKQFANEVYVAISEEFIPKVDIDIFKERNIGLMSVSEERMRIIVKAKKRKVENLDIQYYIVDKFLKQLYGEVNN